MNRLKRFPIGNLTKSSLVLNKWKWLLNICCSFFNSTIILSSSRVKTWWGFCWIWTNQIRHLKCSLLWLLPGLLARFWVRLISWSTRKFIFGKKKIIKSYKNRKIFLFAHTTHDVHLLYKKKMSGKSKKITCTFVNS